MLLVVCCLVYWECIQIKVKVNQGKGSDWSYRKSKEVWRAVYFLGYVSRATEDIAKIKNSQGLYIRRPQIRDLKAARAQP